MKNPVMTASGTFGYGQEYAPYSDLKKLGALVTKGISLEPMAGNPPPRICETASGMLNAIGLQNVGVEAFLRDKLPYLRDLGIPIIVNVLGHSLEEYVEVARRLDGQPGPGRAGNQHLLPQPSPGRAIVRGLSPAGGQSRVPGSGSHPAGP